jgi:hypothetical protein
MRARITDGGSMPRGLRTGPSQWINLVELNFWQKIKETWETQILRKIQ